MCFWALCDCVQSKYVKCHFHICSYGRGKQQPEEGGREVEVALGFRWNWRKTGADACIYVHTLTCGSSHGPHMDTSALMLSSPNLTTSKGWDRKVLELCCLVAVNCNHVTCQETPDKTFGAGAIACVRLCGQAERQILSVKTPTPVHPSLLCLNICARRVPGKDADRCQSQIWS